MGVGWGLRLTGPFSADLHVAHVGAVDDEPHGRAYLVESHTLPAAPGLMRNKLQSGPFITRRMCEMT